MRVVACVELIRFVQGLMAERNLGLIAAGVAFYAILSVFPGLAAVIALWGLVGDPGLLARELDSFGAFVPDQVAELVKGQLSALAEADGLTLGWASILSFGFAIWSARAGVAALMLGLNAIYGVQNRSGLLHIIRSLLLTVALIGVALVALLSVVVLPVVLTFVPLGGWHQAGIELARWVLALGVLWSGFSLIYRLGPNARQQNNLPGALFASVLWAVVSIGFSVYLSHFATYNEVYGSIGAVIALLMWLFLSAWLVLLGGAINAWLSQDQEPDP